MLAITNIQEPHQQAFVSSTGLSISFCELPVACISPSSIIISRSFLHFTDNTVNTYSEICGVHITYYRYSDRSRNFRRFNSLLRNLNCEIIEPPDNNKQNNYCKKRLRRSVFSTVFFGGFCEDEFQPFIFPLY